MEPSEPILLPDLPVALRDGTVARLRPVRPEDGELLVEGFHRLSEASRFARFGAGLSHLTDSEVRYLTHVDQFHHVAWGATVDDQPAGVGRFIRTEEEGCAEVAVAVVDSFQRRGLGRRLFEALVASARSVGVESFCFSVHPSNREVLRMVAGVELRLDESGGLLVGRLHLTDVGRAEAEEDYGRLLELYRGAADPGGTVTPPRGEGGGGGRRS